MRNTVAYDKEVQHRSRGAELACGAGRPHNGTMTIRQPVRGRCSHCNGLAHGEKNKILENLRVNTQRFITNRNEGQERSEKRKKSNKEAEEKKGGGRRKHRKEGQGENESAGTGQFLARLARGTNGGS